jgi:GNAT superfamily N-acetyltransferase
METNIRWLRRADVPAVSRLSRDCGSRSVREWIDDTPAICSVVESEGAIRGFFIYELKRSGPVFLHHIFVDEAFRRRGIGSMVVSSLVKKLGPKRTTIESFIPDDNLNAHLFMKSQGFRAVDVDRDSYRFVYAQI